MIQIKRPANQAPPNAAKFVAVRPPIAGSDALLNYNYLILKGYYSTTFPQTLRPDTRPDFDFFMLSQNASNTCGMVSPDRRNGVAQPQAVRALCHLNLTSDGDTKPSVRRGAFAQDNGDLNGENPI
jgi:hypothetical protein